MSNPSVIFDFLPGRLAEMRKSLGLTQSELAALSNIGVKTIASFEHAPERLRGMKLGQIVRLAEAFDLSLSEFFDEVSQ